VYIEVPGSTVLLEMLGGCNLVLNRAAMLGGCNLVLNRAALHCIADGERRRVQPVPAAAESGLSHIPQDVRRFSLGCSSRLSSSHDDLSNYLLAIVT
jgi:hypothetical protein